MGNGWMGSGGMGGFGWMGISSVLVLGLVVLLVWGVLGKKS